MIDINDEIEHDAHHFEQMYRKAAAAIEGEQNGEGTGVNVILDLISCPRCFVESLLAIAARLARGQALPDAAQQALDAFCLDSW